MTADKIPPLSSYIVFSPHSKVNMNILHSTFDGCVVNKETVLSHAQSNKSLLFFFLFSCSAIFSFFFVGWCFTRAKRWDGDVRRHRWKHVLLRCGAGVLMIIIIRRRPSLFGSGPHIILKSQEVEWLICLETLPSDVCHEVSMICWSYGFGL